MICEQTIKKFCNDFTKIENYEKAVEKTDNERIAELEAMNAELSTTVDSILTDVLPTLMGA